MISKALSLTIKHYIDLEYFANGVAEDFQILLDELKARCDKAITTQKTFNTKLSYNTVLQIIKEEVRKFKEELLERLEETATVISEREVEFLNKTYNTKNKTLLPKLSDISLSSLLFVPFDKRDTVKQFVDRAAQNILSSYEMPLRSGYLFGQDSETIVTQTSQRIKQTGKGIQSGIQTAVPTFAKTTDKIVFMKNLQPVIYCAVLDSATCIVCGSYSGMVFKTAYEAPELGQHDRCRCFLLPASEVTEEIPSYEEFLESLSEEEQKKILGKNRYELWKEEGVHLTQFVNNGRKLRLDEIDI